MSPENIFSLLSLLIAAAAAGGALYSVFLSRNTAETSRKMTRKQATLDFFEKHGSENPFEFGKMIYFLANKKNFFSDPAHMSEIQSLISFLGRYEKLALGLKHEVFDEQIVFDAMAKDVLGMYQLSEPFIMEAREHMRKMRKTMGISLNEKAFCHFEALAKKYKIQLVSK